MSAGSHASSKSLKLPQHAEQPNTFGMCVDPSIDEAAVWGVMLPRVVAHIADRVRSLRGPTEPQSRDSACPGLADSTNAVGSAPAMANSAASIRAASSLTQLSSSAAAASAATSTSHNAHPDSLPGDSMTIVIPSTAGEGGSARPGKSRRRDDGPTSGGSKDLPQEKVAAPATHTEGEDGAGKGRDVVHHRAEATKHHDAAAAGMTATNSKASLADEEHGTVQSGSSNCGRDTSGGNPRKRSKPAKSHPT